MNLYSDVSRTCRLVGIPKKVRLQLKKLSKLAGGEGDAAVLVREDVVNSSFQSDLATDVPVTMKLVLPHTDALQVIIHDARYISSAGDILVHADVDAGAVHFGDPHVALDSVSALRRRAFRFSHPVFKQVKSDFQSTKTTPLVFSRTKPSNNNKNHGICDSKTTGGR